MKKTLLSLALFLILSLIAGCQGNLTTGQPPVEPTRMPVTQPPTDSPLPTMPPTDTVLPPTPSTIPTTKPPPTVMPHPSQLPETSGLRWELVSGGFVRPVDIAYAGDGSKRLFVLEQIGVIRVILEGQMQSDPFLDIRDRVGSLGNEQGLLGIAFHPDFTKNGFFYLNYTDYSGNTVIARFTAPADTNGVRSLADPASEKVLLKVDQPYANHNGGQMAFGPDGYLWIGLGDGGSGGDPRGNGQNTDTLLGKLLRIDVDGGDPYAIPSDNPFSADGGAGEIWAIGLRNPWRFSFDPLTGDLYIGDVGQNQWEEVDYLPGGTASTPVNFGWNIREGAHPYRENMGEQGLIDPIFEYDHSQGCSITGGMVYRGKAIPELNGVYLAGDYCSGLVWGLIPSQGSWTSKILFQTGYSISSFGVDWDGELYLADLNGGVYRLTRP